MKELEGSTMITRVPGNCSQDETPDEAEVALHDKLKLDINSTTRHV